MRSISKSFSLLLIVLLAMSILIMVFVAKVNVVKADSNSPITFSSGLTVYSPLDTVYNSYSVLCNASLQVIQLVESQIDFFVDGQAANSNFSLQFGPDQIYYVAGAFMLPALPNGLHTLTFQIEEEALNWSFPPSAAFQPTDVPNEYVASWVNNVSFTIYSNDVFPTPTPTLTPTLTPTITPTSIPTVSEFPTWAILPLFAVAILPSIVFIRKRNSVNRNVSD